MIAALPMYDWPETQDLNNVLWSRIAAGLKSAKIDTPVALTRSADLLAIWLSPDLLLAQTCSYPLETSLRHKVRYVATPSYDVEGCEIQGHYRSVILKAGREKNEAVPLSADAALPNWLADARLAINGLDSMSGYHALKRDAEAAGRHFPSIPVLTGSHRASIVAVANGNADYCAVDCVSWAMALEHEPSAKHVYVAGWTKSRPGLPLITSLKTSERVFQELVKVVQSVLGATVLTEPTER
jgi:ABC-type phosphate/phosphonate transport system substrate-binding protein